MVTSHRHYFLSTFCPLPLCLLPLSLFFTYIKNQQIICMQFCIIILFSFCDFIQIHFLRLKLVLSCQSEFRYNSSTGFH